MGFEEPTPIQKETVPLALQGADVIGQAQTGTGKTAAFGLPMLNKITKEAKGVQGLVIAPTRELAIQTQEELYELGKFLGVKIISVYGGSNISRQIQQLKNKPHIVVGTPGRLLDHIRRRTLKLDHIETLVLDEADEMLNMGFLEDIETIIKSVPSERQTLLFSATMPNDIKRIGVQFMKNPEHVKVKAKEMTADLIDQYYVRSKDFEKFDILTRLIDVETPDLAIVFGRTKRRVDELARGLEMRGFKAKGIHGDLPQAQRMKVLKDFRAGHIDILVATDVAARGLDITGVTHVYNYDIPQDPESYVHRIGRTGRAGNKGASITFVTPSEMDYLRVIEDLTKRRMTSLRPPSSQEAREGQLMSAVEEVEGIIKNGFNDSDYKVAQELAKTFSSEDLAAALLSYLAKDPTNVEVKITPQRPLPKMKGKKGGNYSSSNSRRKRDPRKGNYSSSSSSSSRKQENRYTGSKSKPTGAKRTPKKNTKGNGAPSNFKINKRSN
ncbi:DEAD/DEAH box helicase [Atopobacter phocae]|uniref:DEAD/DEAH box helicase n=1 Tax=Atopobacter phocae TaxID=136492 RepID=UPI0012EB1490